MRRSKFAPRKTPVQERSRATVDALLTAAADILVGRGYAALTTNAIAERAGVNIASLYQYFPGKEAIVAELRRRHVEEQREAGMATLRELRGQSLEATVRTMVDMGIAVHTVAPRLHRVLTEELPPRHSRINAPDDPLLAEARRHFDSLIDDVPNKELALWMVDTVGYAVIHRALVERPDDVASGSIADELVTLLLRYLRRR
jgi:AcrR family transcriptional regulator